MSKNTGISLYGIETLKQSIETLKQRIETICGPIEREMLLLSLYDMIDILHRLVPDDE